MNRTTSVAAPLHASKEDTSFALDGAEFQPLLYPCCPRLPDGGAGSAEQEEDDGRPPGESRDSFSPEIYLG